MRNQVRIETTTLLYTVTATLATVLVVSLTYDISGQITEDVLAQSQQQNQSTELQVRT